MEQVILKLLFSESPLCKQCIEFCWIEFLWDRSFCVSTWLRIPRDLSNVIALDLERTILKPFVLRPQSRQIMRKILLIWIPFGLFLLCFYLTAFPKSPIERNRIGFGANNNQTFCSQPPSPPGNSAWNFAELKSLGTVPFVFPLDCASQKDLWKRDRIGFGATNFETICFQTPL